MSINMKRPNPKDFQAKQHLRGEYGDALDKYIDYLEARNDSLKEIIKAIAEEEDYNIAVQHIKK